MGRNLFTVLLLSSLAGCNSGQEIMIAERDFEVAKSNLDSSVSSYEHEQALLGPLTVCSGKDGQDFVSCGREYNYKIEKLSANVMDRALEKSIAIANFLKVTKEDDGRNELKTLGLVSSFELIRWDKEHALNEYISSCWMSDSDDCEVEGKKYSEVLSNYEEEILEAKSDQLKSEIVHSNLILESQKKKLLQTLSGKE